MKHKINYNSLKNAMFFLFAFIFSTTFVLAADSTQIPSPVDQLTGLAEGIGALFMGNFAAFIAGIFGAITVIAIFIIVWQLFTFIFEKTIFSIGGESDTGKKYATWLGVGMGLIAVAVPHVYQFIYGFFGGFGMIVFVILVMVFAIWKFVLHNRTDTAKENARFNQSQGENLRAKRERRKEESDTKMQKNADSRVRKDVKKGEKILKNDIHEYMSGEQVINKMKNLMAQLASPNVNRQTQAQIQHELMAKASALAGHIKHEHKDMKRLEKLIRQTERIELKGMQIEKNEANVAQHLIAEFKKDHNSMAQKEEQMIEKFAQQALILDKKRIRLTKDIENLDIKNLQLDDMLNKEIKEFQQALNAGEFAQANNYLKNVEQAYRQVGFDDQKLSGLYRELIKFDREKTNLDAELIKLDKKVRNSIRLRKAKATVTP
ncbi:MAG: hypothetical protein ACOCQQ_02995 [Candidatus Nanoarchaeia archaeon]